MQHLLDRLLEPQLGYTLSPWPTALQRTVQRLAREEGLEPQSYLARVATNRDGRALDRLLSAATIGYTAFMRHPEQFDYLQKVALPSLLQRHGGPLRIWSAGCATGEEAYSLAACAELAQVPVEILATDVNHEFLRIARGGRYPIRKDPPLPMGDVDGDEWVAPDRLRRRIRFEHASLAGSSPALGLGRFHIVFCRNVLIYFRPEAALAMVSRLLREVEPGGMFVVAPVEGVLSVPRVRLPESPPGCFGVDAQALETVAPERQVPPAREAAPTPRTPVTRREISSAGPPARTPPRPLSLLAAAADRLACGDADGAEELACLALDRDPTDVNGWILLGQILLGRGEHTQARIAFLEAAQHADDDLPEVA